MSSPIPGGATVIQLVQPLRLLAGTIDQLEATGTKPIPAGEYMALTIDLLFAMTIDENGDLRIVFDELRPVSQLPLGTQAIVNSQLQDLSVTIALDRSSLDPLVANAPFVFGAVCANESFGRVSIILDLGTGSFLLSNAQWLKFLTGGIANNLDMSWSWLEAKHFPGKTHNVLKKTKSREVHLDWSARLDSRFLTRRVADQVQEGVAGTELELVEPPKVEWVEEYSGQPRLTVFVNGQVYGVGLFRQDVTVWLTATSHLMLIDGPQLQTYTTTDYEVDDGGVQLSSVLLGMFVGMFVGFLPGGVAASGVAMAVGAIFGSVERRVDCQLPVCHPERRRDG